MSERTRDTLRFYKEIGNRPTLVEWRKQIPSDVRRIWLLNFIKEVGTKKLGEPALREVLFQSVGESHRQAIQNLAQKINELHAEMDSLTEEEKQYTQEDLDDYDSRANQIERRMERIEENAWDLYERFNRMIESVVTDDLLEQFAQIYFTYFETDPEVVEDFFEERAEVSLFIGQTLQTMLRAPDFELRQRSVRPVSPDDQEQAAASLQAVVITGSSAIGPRKQEYKRGQDLDLFVLPATTSTPDIKKEKWFLILRNLLDDIYRVMKPVDSDQKAYETVGPELKEFLKLFPEWEAVVKILQEKNIKIDIFLPEIDVLANMDGDWMKWCGPHKVSAILGSEWESVYQYHIQEAIKTARVLGIPTTPEPKKFDSPMGRW